MSYILKASSRIQLFVPFRCSSRSVPCVVTMASFKYRSAETYQSRDCRVDEFWQEVAASLCFMAERMNPSGFDRVFSTQVRPRQARPLETKNMGILAAERRAKTQA
eukprot:scaffold1511_cov170-Amphora_coffeaeformis.AAC.4